MKKFIPVLKRTKVFAGIGEDDITVMLDCLEAHIRHYKKGEYVFRQGENIDNITVLVYGKLYIQRDDYWGNRSIINVIDEGEMFGEAYAIPQSGAILNDVIAMEDSGVIFLDVKRILSVCPSACRVHSQVLQNLFYTISEKNRKLVQKLGHMAQRTTREKLISYLSEESRKHNSSAFEISFNRQQLADFLSVDRSARSNELCKLRDEGLIKFEKTKFVLL